MTTVAIQDKFVETLTAFGNLQESVDTALQRYTIEQISSKITELRRRDVEYKTKYGMTYLDFSRRVGEDEAFVQYVEREVNKMWELDLAD